MAEPAPCSAGPSSMPSGIRLKAKGTGTHGGLQSTIAILQVGSDNTSFFWKKPLRVPEQAPSPHSPSCSSFWKVRYGQSPCCSSHAKSNKSSPTTHRKAWCLPLPNGSFWACDGPSSRSTLMASQGLRATARSLGLLRATWQHRRNGGNRWVEAYTRSLNTVSFFKATSLS